MGKPNILFLVVDCLRADHVYVRGLAQIPTLDMLRAGGFSFLNAISTNAETTPVFGSLLTGRYPFETGIRSLYGHQLAKGINTLPEALHKAGYYTIAEVTGPLASATGLDRGFDEYNFRPKSALLFNDWGKGILERLRNMRLSPWFMLLHLWEIHATPQVLPQCDNGDCGQTRYARALSSVDIYLKHIIETLPENTLLVITGDHGEMLTGVKDGSKRRKRRKKLFRIVKFLHEHRLTRYHPARVLREGCGGHGHLIYDELLKVPLIFHGKGLIAPGVSDKQVRHVDIPATLLDLAGVAPEPGLAGRSLMEMVGGGPGEHRDAYSEVAGERHFSKPLALASLRSENRFKYIYAPFNDGIRPELYDLVSDPQETRNVAEKRPDVAAEMRRKLDAMRVDRMPGVEMSDAEKAVALERLRSLGYHDV